MMKRVLTCAFSITLGILLVFTVICFGSTQKVIAASTGVTRYVSTSGSDLEYCGPVGWPCRTIQWAINLSDFEDNIQVDSGTYDEHITMKDGVSVYGLGWDYTIIDGGFSGPTSTVDFPPGISASTVLSGVKVTRGGWGFSSFSNPNGGGLRISNGSPTIVNTWVYSCTGNNGGGVYVGGGSPTFNNVPVWNSSAGSGGGFFINNASVTLIGNPLDITKGTVLWNSASAAGGGFYLGNATVNMMGLHIYGNSAETGGGIYISENLNKVTLNLNAISANSTSLTGGGGIEVWKAKNLDIFANFIGDPIIGGNVSHGDGGGAFFLESAGSVRNNWFIHNQADSGYGGAAAFCYSSPNLYFSNNWVEGNTAGRDGGGLSLFGNADPKIDGNTIVSNTSRRGAGIDISEAGMVSVTNNIIARNVSNGPLPTIGGIEVLTTTARIINNTIADNTGDAVWFQNSHGIVIVNNILYGNSGYSVYGDTSIHTPYYTVGYNDKYANSYDTYHDVPTGGMDMSVNPQFKTSGDMFNYYHLLRTSPVLTTGSLYWAPYRDIDREVRRCNGTVSMGADDLPCFVYVPSLLR